jgi:hypothetical protein
MTTTYPHPAVAVPFGTVLDDAHQHGTGCHWDLFHARWRCAECDRRLRSGIDPGLDDGC